MLARYNVSLPTFHRLSDEMDRLFDGALRGWPTGGVLSALGGQTAPALNVWEDDQAVFVEAELPGLKLDDIEVLVHRGELTLKGAWGASNESDGATVHRRERDCGSFSRTITLPVEIDAAKVPANLHNGVLTVTLPKSDAAKPRAIEVKALTD